MRVLGLIGSRSDAFGLGPLIQAAGAIRGGQALVLEVGRPDAASDDALRLFGLRPDWRIRADDPDPDRAFAALLQAVGAALDDARPDWLLAAGSGCAVAAATLAAKHAGLPVLMTHGPVGAVSPNPLSAHWAALAERLADLHLPATAAVSQRLADRGVPPERRLAPACPRREGLLRLSARIDVDPIAKAHAAQALAEIAPDRPLIAADPEFDPRALAPLARRADVQIAPLARRAEPHPDLRRLALLRRADLVLTDDPERRWEAETLGRPVLDLAALEGAPRARWSVSRRAAPPLPPKIERALAEADPAPPPPPDEVAADLLRRLKAHDLSGRRAA